MRTRPHVLAAIATVLAACASAPLPEPVTPAGRAVQVGAADPPPGALAIGPIEVTNGNSCGAYGRRGTYEGAYATLRNRAAERGGTYVQLTEQVGPHQSGDCYVNEFVLRGILYGPPVHAATSSGGEAPATCDPPCSPGYTCHETTCIALCNPPCSPGFTCAQDRTCQPAPAE